MLKFELGTGVLDVSTLNAIDKGALKAEFSDHQLQIVAESRSAVDQIVAGGQTVYGVNTGFGPLCTTLISASDTRKLQENILRSHSVGVGQAVPLSVARSMLITKAHVLARGFSGISLGVLHRILWLIDHNYTPFVPIQGSVGASGDLAPLAHLFLPLIGLGQLHDGRQFVPTMEIYQKEGLEPLLLEAKEGLALINGTQFILAYAASGVQRLHNCLEVADIIGAMSLEGTLGSVAPFDPQLHQLRPFKGAIHVAHRLRTLLQGSEMVASHVNCDKVQDPYSIRCMPQVHGASRNAWLHLRELVEIELNAVTDNPVIFSADKTISGGNFHGQLLALPLDYATLAAAELGNISDRRTYLLIEGKSGLPKLLMKNTGINSGFMMPQYTSAALVSENKSLCFPASADSIPTSLGQEDHVSMGSISGRKLNQVIDNLENILAVELLSAAQAFDYRMPMKSGTILNGCHEMIRKHIDHVEEDRIFAEDIAKAATLISSGQLLKTANEIAKNENIDLKGTQHELFGIY
jgi:histidine ammonia-lyase